MEVQDIFEDLLDPGPVNAEEEEYLKCVFESRMLIFEPRTMYRMTAMFSVNLRRHKGRPLTNSWFVYVNKAVTETLAKL